MAETITNKGIDWSSALRIGNHTFAATFLLVALAVFGALEVIE